MLQRASSQCSHEAAALIPSPTTASPRAQLPLQLRVDDASLAAVVPFAAASLRDYGRVPARLPPSSSILSHNNQKMNVFVPRDVRPVDESGAACATALQSRRWWSEPGGTRSSAASSPWQRPRAEMVGAELAVGSRRSARQGGVEVGLGSSEDAPEWSAGEAMEGGGVEEHKAKPQSRAPERERPPESSTAVGILGRESE